ncbi:MAG: UDP-N-acetylmuramoyl-tripeptide--D-alanyl-D-alanine ligase [Erysipelotrichaceae bacterium]
MINRNIASIIKMLDSENIDSKYSHEMIHGVSIDTRTLVSGNLYVPIVGKTFDGHEFINKAIEAGAVACLWDKNHKVPNVDFPFIIVEDTTLALQALAHAYRLQLSCKVVGITGSNGKTSTKDILAAMLSKHYITQKTLGNFNNEIGAPLTLLSLSEECQVAVIEMGMEQFFELQTLSKMAEPDIAIITNVGDAHKENLGSIENIALAKLEILEGLIKGGLLIYDGDQPLLSDAMNQVDIDLSMQLIGFGKNSEVDDYWLSYVNQDDTGLSFAFNNREDKIRLNMFGYHNALNALAAWICAHALGCSDEEIKEGLKNIEVTGLRNELVEIKHCRILNDSYKSNPQSLHAALDTFEQFNSPYKIVVVGDMLDLGSDTDLIHYRSGKDMGHYQIDEVLTIGDLARYIAQGARDALPLAHIEHFETRDNLLNYLKPFLDHDCMILVKGSRAMKLDVLVSELENIDEGVTYE